MAESVERLKKSSKFEAVYKFHHYVKDLELTDEDLAEGKSICVIGAGDNAFIAGFKRWKSRRGKAFVMGVDPAEKRYHQLDPTIINHDARALGFPSDFEGFDMVISYHAVPKYFFAWNSSEEERKKFIDQGKKKWYDYEVANKAGTDDEVSEAVYASLSEMLRITKPGGKVKMFPVEKSTQEGAFRPDEEILRDVIEELQEENPGLQMRFFNDKPSKVGATLKSLFGVKPKEYVYCGLELSKP